MIGIAEDLGSMAYGGEDPETVIGLLGLTTQGALKTLTMATSLGAVVSLPAVVVLGLLL